MSWDLNKKITAYTTYMNVIFLYENFKVLSNDIVGSVIAVKLNEICDETYDVLILLSTVSLEYASATILPYKFWPLRQSYVRSTL